MGLLDKHTLAALDVACLTHFPVYWPLVFCSRLFAHKESTIIIIFALGTSFATWHTQTWYFQYCDLGNLTRWTLLALLQEASLPQIPPATAFAVWRLFTQTPYPSCGIQLSLVVLSYLCLLQPPASETVCYFLCPAQSQPSTHAHHLPSVGSLLPITAHAGGIQTSLAIAQLDLTICHLLSFWCFKKFLFGLCKNACYILTTKFFNN